MYDGAYGTREVAVDIGFIWDEGKYELVRTEHGVTFAEVVAALDDEHGIEFDDPQGHADRYLHVGASTEGRVLAVIHSDSDLPLLRIITAFDANSWLTDEYERSAR